jgi:hypothetical protein
MITRLILSLIFVLILSNSTSYSQTVINGIINSYYQVAHIDSNSILVNDATGLKKDDFIIIIQMKGAIIDTSNTPKFGDIIDLQNAGNFELNQISNVAFNQIFTKKPPRKAVLWKITIFLAGIYAL